MLSQQLLHRNKLLGPDLSFDPIGGSADDRITAPCCAEMGFGTNAGGRGLLTLLMRVVAAAADNAAGVPPGGNVVSPARADGGGMTSRGLLGSIRC